MHKRSPAVIAASLLLVLPGFAKDKAKGMLQPAVLQARTVGVLIDPDSGMSADDPRANQVAQKDVETAFLNWGRLQPVLAFETADLIVVVRRGNGRLVNDTITDPRQNSRPGVLNPTDDGVAAGAQRGRPSDISGNSGPGPLQEPHSQMEFGRGEDSFIVFAGHVHDPINATPVWRYVAKDGLRPHQVPAVGEFKRALEAAEKAAAKKP